MSRKNDKRVLPDSRIPDAAIELRAPPEKKIITAEKKFKNFFQNGPPKPYI